MSYYYQEPRRNDDTRSQYNQETSNRLQRPTSLSREQYRENSNTAYDKSFNNMQQTDYAGLNRTEEAQLRYVAPEPKRGFKTRNDQMPYVTTGRRIDPMNNKLVPESTREGDLTVQFNEAVDNSGPFYLRHWQIWDNAPFLPSAGDVSQDPRYGIQTKGFTAEYKKLN